MEKLETEAVIDARLFVRSHIVIKEEWGRDLRGSSQLGGTQVPD
jgi:hypothetical protein